MSLDNKVVNLADLKVSHDYLLEQDELLSDKIDVLGSGIDDVESTIGNLSNLSTTQKDNIVSAINEVLQTGGKVKSVNSKTGDVVLKTSDLTNDSGYLTNYTETDPTVPSWAKQASKPTYTAQEVGASSIEDMNSEVNTRRAADAQLQSQITALGNGAPIPVETVAEMIDNTKAYLYTGAEAGWLTGYWYTYDSAQAKFIPRGEYGAGTVIDNTLTVPGDAADAKATGDAISEVNGRLDSLCGGVSTEVRQAILTLFKSAAYAKTGLTEEIAVIESWAAIITAITLNKSSVTISGASTATLIATTTPSGGTVIWASSNKAVATVSNGIVTGVGNGTATITASCGDYSAKCTATVSGFAELESITATYTQSGTVHDTADLSDLIPDLVVVANYDDSTTVTLTSDQYALSGTLSVGTSTIVVSYNGMTTTFDVTVTDSAILYQLGETVLDGSDGVDSGITNAELFTYVGSTILIDFEDTANTNTGEARVIWSTKLSYPYNGTNITANVNKSSYNFSNAKGDVQALPTAVPNSSQRIKAVMRIQTDEERVNATIIFDYVVDGVKQTQIVAESIYGASPAADPLTMTIGYGTAGTHWAGTINSMEIYSKLVSDDDVAAFLAS